MRERRSGLYVGSNGVLGYTVPHPRQDADEQLVPGPFLTAVHHESGVASAVDEPWFTGYETKR
jgi:hypothetical protein